MTDINVLIATHNGAEVIARTLAGYAALSVHDIDYKLIIVDNKSSDDTVNLIRTFEQSLPINILSEPRPGKNYAMNTGLGALDAGIIILSDDDSIPHPGFFQAWLNAFSAMPELDLMGGSIVPLFDEQPAVWMLESQPRFEELYALRQNVPEGPISPDRIYGPNMALRASVIQSGLRFDTRIGPDASQKKSYAMGSETAFLRRAVAAGLKTGFAPEPTVSHIVRSDHITADYIDGRAYRMGRGTAFKHCEDGTYKIRARPLPLSVAGKVKRTISSEFKRLRAEFGTDEQKFHARWDRNFDLGYYDEIADRKRQART